MGVNDSLTETQLVDQLLILRDFMAMFSFPLIQALPRDETSNPLRSVSRQRMAQLMQVLRHS